MRLIVGLGNPGKKYEKTRHNAGFLALDQLQEKLQHKNISDWKLKENFNAKVAETKLDLEKILLVKPMTFMNKSGQTINLIMNYYSKLEPSDIIVIHDDIDLDFGEFRIQQNRSSAGHKGVQSIIEHIDSKNFNRVRIGVATKKMKQMEVSDFVLNKFSLLERRKLNKINHKISDKILTKLEHAG